jgi:hypothetical protein
MPSAAEPPLAAAKCRSFEPRIRLYACPRVWSPPSELHGQQEALLPVHETFDNLMLLLMAAPVGGVALASFRHHEHPALAMVTGNKRATEPDDIASFRPQGPFSV